MILQHVKSMLLFSAVYINFVFSMFDCTKLMVQFPDRTLEIPIGVPKSNVSAANTDFDLEIASNKGDALITQ